jgi:flavin reductase (DIM6/NTAB) family NADH-FMN oxidoreductase RutF
VLSTNQRHLLYLLGKISGKQVDKLNEPQVQRNGTSTFDGHIVLNDCHGYLSVEHVAGPIDCGDHQVFVMRVLQHACLTCSEGSSSVDVLYANDDSLKPEALYQQGLDQMYSP